MVTVYDMATGEQLDCAITEAEVQTQQDARAFAVELRLQPVVQEDLAISMTPILPADIAAMPVEQFLSNQID